MNRLPLMCRIPSFHHFHPSACHLFSRQLQTVGLFRVQAKLWTESGGTKRELGGGGGGEYGVKNKVGFFGSSLASVLVLMGSMFGNED